MHGLALWLRCRCAADMPRVPANLRQLPIFLVPPAPLAHPSCVSGPTRARTAPLPHFTPPFTRPPQAWCTPRRDPPTSRQAAAWTSWAPWSPSSWTFRTRRACRWAGCLAVPSRVTLHKDGSTWLATWVLPWSPLPLRASWHIAAGLILAATNTNKRPAPAVLLWLTDIFLLHALPLPARSSPPPRRASTCSPSPPPHTRRCTRRWRRRQPLRLRCEGSNRCGRCRPAPACARHCLALLTPRRPAMPTGVSISPAHRWHAQICVPAAPC